MGSAVRRCLALVVLLTGCDTHLTTLHALGGELRAALVANQVAASWFATLVVRDGVILGAGASAYGELGVVAESVATFRVVDASRPWRQVQAGIHHVCALDAAGEVYCWGDNAQGQLGTGDRDPRRAPTRVVLPRAAIRIVARDEISCAVLDNGEVKCWGFNDENALGLPTPSEPAVSPQPIYADGDVFAEVGVGQGHTCVISPDGRLFCSGRNSEGQLGTGMANVQELRHVQVGVESDWWAVVCSHSTTCGLRAGTPNIAGELWCWGQNMSGQLATGDETLRATPTRVGDSLWQSVDVNAFTICAVGQDGTLACSGRNLEGALGSDGPANNEHTLAPVRSSVASVATGRFHTCALSTAGILACAGSSDVGQLGVGSTTQQRTWVDVPSPE